MWAANRSPTSLVELLLARGAEVNVQVRRKDHAGETALFFAFIFRPKITELLLRAGADPAIRNRAGRTAAEEALRTANFCRKKRDPRDLYDWNKPLKAWERKARLIQKWIDRAETRRR
jgi:hypothetical protein